MRTPRLLFLAVLPLLCTLAACSNPQVDVSVQSPFKQYDRVAVWSTLSRAEEELFLPVYMDAFPKQELVERRDVQEIIGEQDILPDRLDESTRAEIRRILGVKAIVYPSASSRQFAIKVIDTATGRISASCLVQGGTSMGSNDVGTKARIRQAIAAMRLEAYGPPPRAEGVRQATTDYGG